MSEDLYPCPDCGELYARKVWHCHTCRHHWPMHISECANCASKAATNEPTAQADPDPDVTIEPITSGDDGDDDTPDRGGTVVALDAIIISDDRKRKDLGDIDALATSIATVGLLHPPVVTPGLKLIAGERRLVAMRSLGLIETPVTVVTNLDDAALALQAELDENTCRKELLPTELVAQTNQLWEVEAEAAEEREKAGQAQPQSEPSDPKESFLRVPAGQTRDRVAAAIGGVSGRSLEKARAVVKAAAADPELAPLVEQMDRTGKVDAAYRRLRAAEDEKRIVATPVVSGKFRTIVVDPPWDHEGLSLAGRGAPEYAVMSHEQLLAMPVPEWSEDDCHLYLWTTNNFVGRAMELVAAWGFSYKTMLTWVKPRIGLGSYFRSSTEHVLFAVRGHLPTRADDIPTHFTAPLGSHSEKPQEFFAIAERASYAPYLEAFARNPRNGWEVWGNVCDGDDDGNETV